MSVQDVMIFLVVQIAIISLTWFLSRLASKEEVKSLRHKTKNLVTAIKLAATMDDFSELRYLDWKELDEDGKWQEGEPDRRHTTERRKANDSSSDR